MSLVFVHCLFPYVLGTTSRIREQFHTLRCSGSTTWCASMHDQHAASHGVPRRAEQARRTSDFDHCREHGSEPAEAQVVALRVAWAVIADAAALCIACDLHETLRDRREMNVVVPARHPPGDACSPHAQQLPC